MRIARTAANESAPDWRGNRMRRRECITVLCGGVVAWSLAAGAQPGAQLVRWIGILSGFAEDPLLESELLRPLAQLNRDHGRTMHIDLRWGAGDIDRIRRMAQELVASQPDMVITVGTPATVAVQRETRTIPIVFLVVADPVGAGIVHSLARPGGNTTGFGNPEGTFGGKLLSLLKGMAPGMRRAAAMFNPDTAPGRGLYYLGSFEGAARSLAIEPLTAEVRSDADIGRTKPVALPPGRAMLSTKPAPTGSATIANIIGTVRVACSNGPTCAVPLAKTTSGASATNSAAYLRVRSASPKAPKRYSIRKLRPSLQPNSSSRCRNAASQNCTSRLSAAPDRSTPIRRIRWPCCARAASGHAAAPPSSVMNWRRLTSSMGSPPEPAVPAYSRLRMCRNRPAGPWGRPESF